MKTSDNDLKVNLNLYPDAVNLGLPLGHYPTFSYSDECRTKKKLSVCQTYVAAFSCCGKFL